ncbi:MAG: hypothetical protein ABI868_18940 [Acidobacteriota bacterium]
MISGAISLAVIDLVVATLVLTYPLCVMACSGGEAQTVSVSDPAPKDAIWETLGERDVPGPTRRTNILGRYAIVRLNKPALDALLAGAPLENTPAAAGAGVVISLPLPDGRFSRFRVEESPTLAPELAAAFPGFKTYRGTGLDDPTASTRFGWTDAGFHAVILAAGGSVYIDPYSRDDLSTYVSYRESDLRNDRKDRQPR